MDDCKEAPLLHRIPYRNLTFDVTLPPFAQENDDSWSIESRVMNDYDLFIGEAGCAEFAFGGECYRLEPGMLLLVPPRQPISARKVSVERVRMVAQHFTLNLFQSTDFFAQITYKPLVTPRNGPLIRSLTDEIRRRVQDATARWQPQVTTPLFSVIVHEFIECAYQDQRAADGSATALVVQIITWIDSEFRRSDLVEHIMERSPYGYSHTANLFRAHTGRSLKRFIVERRLEAGKAALLEGKTVRDSAVAAGYEDEFAYSRIFTRYEGVCPREFRRRV